jgi:putative ABC transport system permease protein
VGDTLMLSLGATPTAVTLTGIVDASSAVFAGARLQAYAPFELLGPDAAEPRVLVLADGRIGEDALAERLADELPGLTVLTGADQAAEDVGRLDGDGDVLGLVLLAFAAIAVLVAGIVVANTFTILVTQRRRQLALLRCVGAGRRQLRSQVLLEALLVGAIGAMLGVACGVGIGLLAARLTDLDAGGPAFPLLRLGALVGVGVLITLGAAWWPARRAMRVSPLSALRDLPDATERHRSRLLRTIAGGLLVLGGVAALGYGAQVGGLPVALAGGALSAIGVLALTPMFVPPLLRLAGVVARAGGVPARLAAGNVDRNPARASAAGAALMVGVGLMVTLQVGATSAAATLNRAVDQRYPVDVAMTSDDGALPVGLAEKVGAIDGVAGVEVIPGVIATAPGLGRYGPGSDGGTDGFPLLGVPASAGRMLEGRAALPSDDTLYVPAWWLESGDLTEGERIVVSVGSRSAMFTVAAAALAEVGPAGSAAITSADALAALAPRAQPLAVWAGISGTADITAVTSALNTAIGPYPLVELTGSAAERAATAHALGTVVTLATGMLAVAVVIAVLGIGNTIGLSVLERRRENALLRALGLSRAGLLRSLLTEAVLLGTVGALVGAVAGIGYGWAGTAAAVGPADGGALLAVPWLTLTGVVALVVFAGVVAAVIPATRATRVAPAAALALE